eukprot:gene14747-1108_t
MAAEGNLSEYEKARLANIAENAKLLKALGLDCARVTLTAQGRQAPLPKSKRRQIRPPAEGWRRSERLLGKTVDYK